MFSARTRFAFSIHVKYRSVIARTGFSLLSVQVPQVPVLQSGRGGMVSTAYRVFFSFVANSQYIYVHTYVRTYGLCMRVSL